MTDKCFDIGIIQAFLDGELASEKTETVARHVSACDACAMLLADAEEESAIAFSALDQEFNTLVPTQRLWTKINDSIAREKKSFWKPIFAFLLQPQTAALASLIFVAVVSITLLSLKPDAPIVNVAQNNIKDNIKEQSAIKPVSNNQPTPLVQTPQVLPAEKDVEIASYSQNKNEVRALKTYYVKPETNRTPTILPTIEPDYVAPTPSENVSGEESYIKTIATLTETVNTRKDEILDSSARFSFERDLAVTDDAIARMKSEVKRNPKNEAAKDILRASYQNKIDLLNSVADKTELMASLK